MKYIKNATYFNILLIKNEFLMFEKLYINFNF